MDVPRCLIVDDHPSTTQCLALLMEQVGMETHVAHTVDHGLTRLRELRPALAVIDWNLDAGSGLEVIAEAATITPETACVLYSAFPSFGLILRARDAGARGVCAKIRPLSELREILLSVLRGAGWVLDPYCIEVAMRERLTPAESQALRDLALGVSAQVIADRDQISLAKIYRDRSALCARYGLNSPLAVVEKARRTGALPDSLEQGLLR